MTEASTWTLRLGYRGQGFSDHKGQRLTHPSRKKAIPQETSQKPQGRIPDGHPGARPATGKLGAKEVSFLVSCLSSSAPMSSVDWCTFCVTHGFCFLLTSLCG